MATQHILRIKAQLADPDFGFSKDDQARMFSEVWECARKAQERTKQPTKLTFSKDHVIVTNEQGKGVFGVIKPTQFAPVIMKDVETVRFHTQMKHFKRHVKDDGEEVLFHHNALDAYQVCKVNELIAELKALKDFKLHDCHVRTFKHLKGIKYARITVVPPEGKETSMSRVEFCFGHMINGFTYIMPLDVWKARKADIIAHVAFTETEFGKNTRFNFSGSAFKKN